MEGVLGTVDSVPVSLDQTVGAACWLVLGVCVCEVCVGLSTYASRYLNSMYFATATWRRTKGPSSDIFSVQTSLVLHGG